MCFPGAHAIDQIALAKPLGAAFQNPSRDSRSDRIAEGYRGQVARRIGHPAADSGVQRKESILDQQFASGRGGVWRIDEHNVLSIRDTARPLPEYPLLLGAFLGAFLDVCLGACRHNPNALRLSDAEGSQIRGTIKNKQL